MKEAFIISIEKNLVVNDVVSQEKLVLVADDDVANYLKNAIPSTTQYYHLYSSPK